MDSSDSEPSCSKKTFKCTEPNCSASFSKNHKLISHIRSRHTGERPFCCEEPGCGKTYTNNSHLRRHKKVSHGEKKTEQVMCDFEGCGLILANKYSLKKHCNRKHNPENYPFKCSECKQGFHRKKQLQQHSYIHTGEGAFSCDICDLNFITSRTLNKHKRSHRVYNCDCGRVFHRWSLLLTHKKICITSRFTCDVCDKTFSHLGNFKDHQAVHKDTSEKLVFVCVFPGCKRFYFQKRNLKHHVNVFHKKDNENQSFKCTHPSCKVILKSKQSLKMHLQRHFLWKKKRRIRCDKGTPKKTVVSVLLGDHSYATDNKAQTSENQICVDENKQNNNNNAEATSEIIEDTIDGQITDDYLLKQCDLTLSLLKKKMITAV